MTCVIAEVKPNFEFPSRCVSVINRLFLQCVGSNSGVDAFENGSQVLGDGVRGGHSTFWRSVEPLKSAAWLIYQSIDNDAAGIREILEQIFHTLFNIIKYPINA